MLITQIALYQSRIKLKEPFKISLGALEYAENVIVVFETDSGLTGFGECSPFATIHGETMATCYSVGEMIANHLIGKDPLEIESCHKLMDALIFGNTSIKSAFDIALYDIASKHAGLPLFKFLGGNYNKTILTDYTVSIDHPEKMASDAKEIIDRGFQIIKVKLGGSYEDDLTRMKTIRKAVGDNVPIRIDANQGWDKETAIRLLQAFEKFNIQHCEEPVNKRKYNELPSICRETSIPIMADESCFDHIDGKKLIDLKACQRFNIKLGKSSGIFKALKVINQAENAGLSMQVGGFLESRLGFTASAHLALCSDMIKFYDFDTPLMFEKDPVKGGIIYEQGGVVKVPEAPGLGAWVEETELSKLNKVVIGIDEQEN